MPRARGTKKNLLLTLWLILPFLVVGGLVAGIFITYAKGPTMDARPVGQGAGDTGGANAIGELLAGNDPDQRARTNRDLREGTLIDPLDWPGGVSIMLQPATTAVNDIYLLSWTGNPAETPRRHTYTGNATPVPPENARPITGRVGAGGDRPTASTPSPPPPTRMPASMSRRSPSPASRRQA